MSEIINSSEYLKKKLKEKYKQRKKLNDEIKHIRDELKEQKNNKQLKFKIDTE